jgi:hypothetical protein
MMARARFTDDFDYRPTQQSVIAYRAGNEYRNMKREAVDQAVAAGKAVEIRSRRAAKIEPTEEAGEGSKTISG